MITVSDVESPLLRGLPIRACTKWWGPGNHILVYYMTQAREEVYLVSSAPQGDWTSSAAFVPLGADAALGFLVIGSRDADHFHPGKRMDFLAWLGELLAVCLSREQL